MEEKETQRVGIIETWLRKHRHIYNGATRHPFILSIRDGSVNFSSFRKWLGQDYIFVRALVPFVATTLVKACKQSGGNSDMELILRGLASLSDELEWFKNQASILNVSLTSIVPENTNLNYCRFVESLMSGEVEYAVAMAAYWAIEAVYQESFAHCLEDGSKTPEEFKETCRRWGNEDFGNYCKALGCVAERCLENAGAEVVSRAEVAFLQVLEHEIEFWNMSLLKPSF